MSMASRMQVAVWDVAAAAGLLTRLPIRVNTERAQIRGAAAAWSYTLIGGFLGALGSFVGLTALAFGLPVGVCAALALIAGIFVSGALHEDGLADTADGFWGGWTPERRLEIMRDSRIGTYGVLALGLSLLVRWSLLNSLIEAETLFVSLVAASAAAQAAMVVLWAALPSARTSGLAANTGRPGRKTALAAAACAGVILFWLVGVFQTLAILIALGGIVLGFRRLAMAKIGGHTGDVLGAVQQVSLIVALTVLAS